MSSSCQGLLQQFVQCLIDSDCVKARTRTRRSEAWSRYAAGSPVTTVVALTLHSPHPAPCHGSEGHSLHALTSHPCPVSERQVGQRVRRARQRVPGPAQLLLPLQEGPGRSPQPHPGSERLLTRRCATRRADNPATQQRSTRRLALGVWRSMLQRGSRCALVHVPSRLDVQQCSAAAVARSETHALASTSGRGRSASIHVQANSLSHRGHVSGVPRSQHTRTHLPPRFVTAAASSSSSSRHGSTAQTEALTEGVEGLRGTDATSDRWQHGDGRAVQTTSQPPSAAAAAASIRNNGSIELGNGNGDATADGVAGDSAWQDEHSGSNGAGNHDVAGSWNGAGTAGSDANDDGPEVYFGSEEASDAEEEDDEGAIVTPAPPAAAEADTSVPERVREWELSFDVKGHL